MICFVSDSEWKIFAELIRQDFEVLKTNSIASSTCPLISYARLFSRIVQLKLMKKLMAGLLIQNVAPLGFSQQYEV